MRYTRRAFLLAASAAALAQPRRLIAQPRFTQNPFTLGVAAGYPLPDGIVLWTRLAPDPLNGGGMPVAAVEVAWEIAADAAFRQVLHKGESSWGSRRVRSHARGEPVTLAEYRDRYALYKSDPDLQAAHAAFAWLVTWDDHEVSNDYANDRSQYLDPPAEFLQRRAAAYQAYYEHMPLPAWARPRGAAAQLYTQSAFGQLARFYVIDDRQYRSHQPCARPGRGGSAVVNDKNCAARLAPELSLLGLEQERWLAGALELSAARWNIIAQQTQMAQHARTARAGPGYWTDGWDGYPRARERLLDHIAQRKVSNPLVVGGDIHCGVVADLKRDFDDDKSAVVATEFVGTSITSQGPSLKSTEAARKINPHLKWVNGARRGYTAFDVTPERCTVRMRAVSNVADPQATISDLATFVVESGRAGAQPA